LGCRAITIQLIKYIPSQSAIKPPSSISLSTNAEIKLSRTFGEGNRSIQAKWGVCSWRDEGIRDSGREPTILLLTPRPEQQEGEDVELGMADIIE
jgi:hypothetical protein